MTLAKAPNDKVATFRCAEYRTGGGVCGWTDAAHSCTLAFYDGKKRPTLRHKCLSGDDWVKWEKIA